MQHRKRIEGIVRHFPENGLKVLLENPANVRDVLDLLAFRLIDRIDFSRMKVERARFVHRDYRHLESDVVLKAPFRSRNDQASPQEVIIYILIEHQSEPDALMISRVLEYVVLIFRRQMQEWSREHGSLDGFQFRPVLPVVLYTGTRTWESLGQLVDLVAFGEEWTDLTPSLKPLFLNLGQVSDAILSTRGGGFGWLLRLIQQRKMRRAVFEDLLIRVVRELEQLATADQMRWLELLSYIHALVYHEREKVEHDPLQEMIAASVQQTRQPEASTMGQTIREWLIEQGMEKGIKMGEEREAVRSRKVVLLGQLRSKFKKVPARIVKRVEATTNVDQLAAWLDEFANANKLDDMSLAQSH